MPRLATLISTSVHIVLSVGLSVHSLQLTWCLSGYPAIFVLAPVHMHAKAAQQQQ